jgi:muramoyltetrapeptide carboxypeptidase
MGVAMTQYIKDAILPAKLQPGDRVRLVSPASTPTRKGVEHCMQIMRSWGLRPEIGDHVFDEYGYLAGKDEDRLADMNDAIRDPGVRAVIATRGGKGAYRIAGDLDFAAMRRNPKLYVGFSENTIIELALWKHCHTTSIHGGIVSWNVESMEQENLEKLRRMLMTTDPVVVAARKDEPTAALTTTGKVSGFLMGGNQDMVATAAGWALPSLDGAILLLEDVDKRLGFIDRQLTLLENAGHLKGIRGVAVGRYYLCGPDETTQGDWTAVDVLRDRLHRLGVPIVGGLPLGHGDNTESIPLGTFATLDADAGVLRVAPAVK